MPYSGFEKKEDSDKIKGKGIIFQLIEMLSKDLNFTYIVSPPKEDIIGNSTHGMLAMIYNQVGNYNFTQNKF